MLFRECAALDGIPTQEFVVRNDMGCGSTIGPILSAQMGVRTVDVGVPQLSMHSIREMCGTEVGCCNPADRQSLPRVSGGTRRSPWPPRCKLKTVLKAPACSSGN